MNVSSETIQTLRQLLDAEEQSEDLTKLPRDVYQKTATYIQKLRKTTDNNPSDPSSRLARKQLWLLEGMGRQLLDVRGSQKQSVQGTQGSCSPRRSTSTSPAWSSRGCARSSPTPWKTASLPSSP